MPAFVPDNGESKSRVSLSIAGRIEIVLCSFYLFFKELLGYWYVAGRLDLKGGMGALFLLTGGEIDFEWGAVGWDQKLGSTLSSECWSVPKDHGVSVVVGYMVLRRVASGKAMWLAKS